MYYVMVRSIVDVNKQDGSQHWLKDTDDTSNERSLYSIKTLLLNDQKDRNTIKEIISKLSI